MIEGGNAFATVGRYFEEAESQSAEIDLEELWELLLGQEDRITLEGLAELCFPLYALDHRSVLYDYMRLRC